MKQHLKNPITWWLILIALFILGTILLQIFRPETFWYDSSWRWQK